MVKKGVPILYLYCALVATGWAFTLVLTTVQVQFLVPPLGRRLFEEDHPLEISLDASVSHRNSKLVLRDNTYSTIQWDAFSSPELNNFVQMLHREEELYVAKVGVVAGRWELYEAKVGVVTGSCAMQRWVWLQGAVRGKGGVTMRVVTRERWVWLQRGGSWEERRWVCL